MNISPAAVNRVTHSSPAGIGVNPFDQKGMHRYMVAEEGNTKHWIELFGPDLEKGRVYKQHVLYRDLGDVSGLFVHVLLFGILLLSPTYEEL
jgi:hypothetical protein